MKLNGQRVELGEIEEVILSTSRDSTTLGCDLLQVDATTHHNYLCCAIKIPIDAPPPSRLLMY